jgi:hypothetical protein
VNSSSDRHFTVVDERLKRVHFRAEGSTVPSEEPDFGGMSGGAVFPFDDGLRNPRLGGFLYETQWGAHAHLMVVHADFLIADGTLDQTLIGW